jgi:CPA2 family monovalent cation:H+ antiporter-2
MLRGIHHRSSKLGDLHVHLPEIEISAIRLGKECPHIGQSLASAELRNRYGITVLAISRENNLLVNLDSSAELLENDILYVIGSSNQCARAGRVMTGGEQQ